MSSKKYSLGIDIGTTSVKVCIFDYEANQVLAKQSKDTQANVPSDLGSEGNKQYVPKIISAMHSCVSRLPKELLKQVRVIGVCGQMHGVMLWSNEANQFCWERTEVGGPNRSFKLELQAEKISNLYTWQDTRCEPKFLESLPMAESHVKVHTGYGCATLFWFAKYRPEKIAKYNCSASVQDFAVAILCDLEKPVTSSQIAASWGFFNTTKRTWNSDLLSKAGFPVHLLPRVVEPGETVGSIKDSWFGIPAGTPVGAALGDFQCSVLATISSPNHAALNISTSAQIAYLMADSFEPDPHPLPPPLTFFPYFDGQYLAVGASLNGGNVLATFVKMLQQWSLDLGFSVPQSKVWEKLADLGARDDSESSLQVIPTLLGERHLPLQNASVLNLDPGNLSLGQIFRALCKSIINNLHSMIPKEILEASNIVKIMGSGSALIKNKVLQSELEKLYKMPVEIITGKGACVGAALALSK